MRYSSYIILILISLTNIELVHGQYRDWVLHTFTTGDGLSEGSNTYIMKDSIGYLWTLGISSVDRFDGINFRLAEEKMTYSGLAISSAEFEIDENRLIKLGMKYIHSPYLWGGRSPFGIDGSGLIQMIYKLAGVKIPRDTTEQIKLGNNVDFPSDAKSADLAFFDDTKGNICHVGMITEEKRILHAYGKVRVDYFDHHGIYNEDLGKYTHKLRVIKRPTLFRNSNSGMESMTLSN